MANKGGGHHIVYGFEASQSYRFWFFSGKEQHILQTSAKHCNI
jgi:hypothetical protein